MSNELGFLEVSINDKVVKLRGKFVGSKYCVDSSSIDNHPSLSSDEKESLKRKIRSDKMMLIK